MKHRFDADDPAVKAAFRFANRIRKAVGKPIRRKWRPGTPESCPIDAMIDVDGLAMGGEGQLSVSKELVPRLREAGLEVKKTTLGFHPYHTITAREQEELAEFVRAADARELADEIQGEW